MPNLLWHLRQSPTSFPLCQYNYIIIFLFFCLWLLFIWIMYFNTYLILLISDFQIWKRKVLAFLPLPSFHLTLQCLASVTGDFYIVKVLENIVKKYCNIFYDFATIIELLVLCIYRRCCNFKSYRDQAGMSEKDRYTPLVSWRGHAECCLQGCGPVMQNILLF